MVRVKNLINKFLNKYGYKILRTESNDLQDYMELYPSDDVINKKFYNIGAGTFQHKVWTNVDFESDWYSSNKIDINYDLLSMSPLPIPDSSANIIYTSHTIEHISNEATQHLFNQSYRVLKPGGVIRITCPDIDLLYNILINNDRKFFKNEINTCEVENISLKQLFLYEFASQASILHPDSNNILNDIEFDKIFSHLDFESALDKCLANCNMETQRKYPGNHINWFNKNKLFRMLKSAGFTNVYDSRYGQSLEHVLRNILYFDTTHPERSLYVEARKH